MTHFHAGEVAVQQRMGQAHIADRVGRTIRADIPDIAAGFLAEQPMVVIAAADLAGRVWAAHWSGRPDSCTSSMLRQLRSTHFRLPEIRYAKR